MSKIFNNYFGNSTFIQYKNGLTGGILILGKNGTIPVELKEEDLSFLEEFPNIMLRLKRGETLYINSVGAIYLGMITYDGPYCENEIFLSNYDNNNGDFIYRLNEIEKSIAYEEPPKIKKLIRVGDRYLLSN